MTWSLSRYRAGDVVEICSKEEILATLDQHGCIDGMPFMPEMIQFCGKQFRVRAVAHKTCDTVQKTGSRRLQRTVHLAGVRCDGSAHGGCEADCSVFWKDQWLKPVSENGRFPGRPMGARRRPGVSDVQPLTETCLHFDAKHGEPRYICQATKLFEATKALAFWNVRQYVFDILTRNHSVSRVARVLWLASLRRLLAHVPFGYRIVKQFSEWMHHLLTNRPSPSLCAKIKLGAPTPTGQLDLKPGEYVRVKPKAKIEETVDEAGKNRGLGFDPEEMAPYCDRVFKVRRSVTRIIDEASGKMLLMKHPCIILEGVVCNAEYAGRRLNCPRAIRPYWRELWLERVERRSVFGNE